jgi:hypothetical protein
MALAYWRDLGHIPRCATRPPYQFLYVVCFSDGVVKAGRSATPRGRILAHIIAARKRGVRATDIHVEDGRDENELLRRLRRIACSHTGREWFTGIRFSDAKQLVRQVARNVDRCNSHRAA